MPINEHTKSELSRRAGGKCECTMSKCTHHTGRCNAMLRGGWEAHRLTAGGAYVLSNLKGHVPNVPSEDTELRERVALKFF